MISFIKMFYSNADGTYKYTDKDMIKLYRFYLYLFRPYVWNFYKKIYRVFKYIQNKLENLF